MRFPSLLPLALTLAAACAAPPQHGLLEGEPKADLLQRQIRARVAESARVLSTDVSSAVADIVVESDDPGERRSALIFWSRVSDEAGRALYHQDPVAAAVDLAALVCQLQGWLAEGGDGARTFGPHQERVRETIDSFAVRLAEAIAMSEAAVVREETWARARDWAQDHPLEGSHFSRVSIAPLMQQLGTSQGRSVFAMADSVESSVSSIETRLDVMGHRMPAQFVAQTGFLLEAYLERIRFEELLEQAGAELAQVEDLDQVLARERATTLAEVDRQRKATFTEVLELTSSLGDFVTAERLATLDVMEAMRAETLEDLERQRVESLERLEVLHARTLEELDRQTQTLADRLDGVMERSLGRPVDEQRAEMMEDARALTLEAVAEGLSGARGPRLPARPGADRGPGRVRCGGRRAAATPGGLSHAACVRESRRGRRPGRRCRRRRRSRCRRSSRRGDDSPGPTRGSG